MDVTTETIDRWTNGRLATRTKQTSPEGTTASLSLSLFPLSSLSLFSLFSLTLSDFLSFVSSSSSFFLRNTTRKHSDRSSSNF
mmetsp:Transcript_5851/g.14897  ORF Transcript_5851/g.14897 Transcript_5851/m.14897 type:complete len:83 (+) Transcript_5851:215-463(+)